MYFDGVNVSGTSANPTNVLTLAEDATFTLRARPDGSAPATGIQIAELAVWDRILSPSQITSLASGSAPTEIDFCDCDYDGIDDRTQLVETRQFHFEAGWSPDDVEHDRIEETPEVDGMTLPAPVAPALSDVTLTLKPSTEDCGDASNPTC